MKMIILALTVAFGISACTTGEKTASGAGIGALAGAAISNSAGGAIAGALIGGFGTYLVERADGNCEYRQADGRVVTRRCHYY